MVDFAKRLAQVKQLKDMTKSQGGGGGEYTPPAEGFVRLRFVGYYELGQHEDTIKGVTKTKQMVRLVFELSGPKHAPVERDGVKYPQRMSMDINLSLNEKANLFKMFQAMNWEGKATHMAELLGNAFVANIKHNKKTYDGVEKTFANLENIRKPFIDSMNDETGEVEQKPVNVDPAITPLGLFVWELADREMWDSIFIDGEYEARKNEKGEETSPARSKNVIQNKIREAKNFQGLPCYDYAAGAVKADDADALDAAIGESEALVAGSEPDALTGIA